MSDNDRIRHRPPSSTVDGFKALIRYPKPDNSANFCVFAYVLNRDIVGKDGQPAELYGCLTYLASFETQEEAEKFVGEAMYATTFTSLTILGLGSVANMSSVPDRGRTTTVRIDRESETYKILAADDRDKFEAYEKKVKILEDVLKEVQDEKDVDHIDHYKRAWYMAIKCHSAWKSYEDQAREAEKLYLEHKQTVREHYSRHPDHDKEWLPYLQNKLLPRGEEHIFHNLKANYTTLRSEVLGD